MKRTSTQLPPRLVGQEKEKQEKEKQRVEKEKQRVEKEKCRVLLDFVPAEAQQTTMTVTSDKDH